MIKLFVDGAATGKEGYAAIGILVVENGVQEQIGLPLEARMDNHQAEFEAILYGLRYLKKHSKQDQLVFCYTDSKLVAESIRKKYTKKAEHKLLLEETLQDLAAFTNFYLEWIPEKENKGADNLAKKALYQLTKMKK
ncbi:ribonuclease HI family protein [Trichococcus collinsii]|uniref:Ribonuclease HI n=1 Tax=Trichococcus collinsii TaxID=157076 RepID=A0AB37ZX38_9LACT|nr:ribonuclease HI family protein [Trichococcus collinsii]CZQ80739.1 rnase h [Trichococcus collinsii]SDZ91972.1 ribonuclease HI [Trichococcus collinsii]